MQVTVPTIPPTLHSSSLPLVQARALLHTEYHPVAKTLDTQGVSAAAPAEQLVVLNNW